MAELPPILTLTTISSDWANDVQDRLIQRYATVAARTTEHSSPVEGDLSYLEDSNTVWVYDGSAWVAGLGDGTVTTAKLAASVLVDPVRAGVDQDTSAGALTTSLVAKASVVFTKPAGWATYAVAAWGDAVVHGVGATSISARVSIGASNGATVTLIPLGPICAAHSVASSSASPVTIAIAVAEVGGDANYLASTISYIAYRLT